MNYETRSIKGLRVTYRPGTSDERVLSEVFERGSYRKKSINFDVSAGECWLDLGANIGAFALYCQSRGAIAECYEPDEECFKLLKLNAHGYSLNCKMVSANLKDVVQGFKSPNNKEHSRLTLFEVNKFQSSGIFTNVYAGNFTSFYFDGIKMDIEGAEGEIIDDWLLPKCNKLVLEYHSSRDKSVGNFRSRLGILKKHFQFVNYPPELDRILNDGRKTFDRWIGTRYVQYPMKDRLIFCYNEA